MSDPIPAPIPTPPPAPPTPPPPEWLGRWYWKIFGYAGGMRTLAGDAWKVFYNVSGPLALALVLFGHQGCSLPHIPWPTPGPTPTPVPPQPPSPIPGQGLRVLVVYESAELSKLPKEQATILSASEVRDYLNTTCAAGPDGKTREWRILDKDTDLTNESAVWQSAMKRPRQSLPWIVVGNGKTGYEGPLPGTVADVLALLKKYAGS